MEQIAEKGKVSSMQFDPDWYTKYLLSNFLKYQLTRICFYCENPEVVKKVRFEKKYEYYVQTQISSKNCTQCGLWVHNSCSFQFFNENNDCIPCCPYDLCFQRALLKAHCSADQNKTDSSLAKDESYFLNLMATAKPGALYKGFKNPPSKNMCWLNASLQILFSLPVF